MLCTRNNTDGIKLVIFSGIALYYGGTYILLQIETKILSRQNDSRQNDSRQNDSEVCSDSKSG